MGKTQEIKDRIFFFSFNMVIRPNLDELKTGTVCQIFFPLQLIEDSELIKAGGRLYLLEASDILKVIYIISFLGFHSCLNNLETKPNHLFCVYMWLCIYPYV